MPYTVVIADDEPIIRMDLADMLAAAGLAVLGQAADGFDAVELARQHRPDVVLLDINMPVFDGLTAARQIIGERLAKAVLLVTAYCDAKFIETAKEVGAGGYLVKPIQERALLPAIEIALAQSERFAAAEAAARQATRQAEEQRLISRAKAALAQRLQISEQAALAMMQKESMNKRCTLAAYAAAVLRADPDADTVQQAKRLLMARHDLSEKAAYRRLKALSETQGRSIAETARALLREKRP